MNKKAIEELVESSEEIKTVSCGNSGIRRPDITYELLYEMYVVKRMSTTEIAEELGCSQPTVWSKLKEFGIETRSLSEAISDSRRDENIWNVEWTQYQKEVLDGMLLGDGSIYADNKCMSARYTQGCKYKEFLSHVVDIFPGIFGENNPYIHQDKWAIKSKLNEYLTEQRHRWYSERKKILPEDIEITPIVLLYWYLGDGNLSDGKQVSIGCCSLYDGLDLVIPQLEEMGLFFKKWKDCIGLLKECNDRFFELIGKSPVECYFYKWPFKYLTVEERKLAVKYKQGLL